MFCDPVSGAVLSDADVDSLIIAVSLGSIRLAPARRNTHGTMP
jgi:hypothetical protein